MTLGLFPQLLLRLILLLLLMLAPVLVVTHVYQQRSIDAARRAELDLEAKWVAHDLDTATPATVAALWRVLEPGVRLSILDMHGGTLADSGSATPQDGATSIPRVEGRAASRSGSVVLSSARTPAFDPQWRGLFSLWLAGVVGFAAFGVLLWVGRVNRVFRRLTVSARRVAHGEYGEVITPGGPRELQTLTSSFNDMAIKLRDEEQRKRRLIADVSHELRSPLGRLRALGETIARRPTEAAPHLLHLQSEIMLMDRLINDMLTLARVELGATVFTFSRTLLNEWSALVFMSMRVRIETAGVACAIEAQPNADIAIDMDAARMTQVIGNLVDNALLATRGRANACITLSATNAGDMGEIHVEDNGAGIAGTDLPHVFERFYRAGTGDGGGVGLGLSIARAIVEAHQGSITIESSVPDTGTRVNIRLPRAN